MRDSYRLGSAILDRLRGLFSDSLPAPAASLAPKVLVLNFDPILPSKGNRPLHQAMGWNEPTRLTETYIRDLADCSSAFVRYQIADWQDVGAFPVKRDGFRYSEDSYLRCWANQEAWHAPDAVDYGAIFRQFDVPQRVAQGEIDEVWLWGFPYAGFWESTMAGPGAYFCNSPPVQGIAVSRLFVTMGFNYERGVGEMLESFGHRVESIMRHVYGSWEPQETHAWNRFTLHEQIAPGRAACGNVHFAPNSEQDYDWGNRRMVWSSCDDWLNYPHLTGERRRVNCEEWGNGDIRAHHRWWLRHLPQSAGHTEDRLNNWWAYVVSPHRFP
jgi:hypothetical protein